MVAAAMIEREISRLADLIGASGFDVVGFAAHVDAGCPYIQIGDDRQLHWIVKERGEVLEHRITRDPDELLYWSFQATTSSIASSWEARHGDGSRDFRVGRWAKQQNCSTSSTRSGRSGGDANSPHVSHGILA